MWVAAASAVAMASCSTAASIVSTGPTEVVPVEFIDSTIAAGLSHENFTCIAWADFNDDSLPDLVLGPISDLGVPPGIVVNENRGDGRFVAHKVALATSFIAMSCAAADIDGDGHQDIVVGHAPATLSVLTGDGSFNFVEVPGLPDITPTGVAPYGVSAVALFDFDRDGFLDILGGLTSLPSPNECEFSNGDFHCSATQAMNWTPTFLLRNGGAGSFSRAASAPGRRDAGAVHSFGFIDFDNDGWIDVFATQDFTMNALYLNKGGTGEFVDITETEGIGVYNHGMGSAFADFDNDGGWDIYVADLGPDQMWSWTEQGRMEDEALENGIADSTRFHSGWSPLADDFNNDGFLDVFVTNSALVSKPDDLVRVSMGEPPEVPTAQADFMLLGGGGGRYIVQLVPHSGSQDERPRPNGGASVLADYDADGDLDVAQFYQAPATFRLLENRTAGAGHWIQVDLAMDHVAMYSIEAYANGSMIGRRLNTGGRGSVGQSWATIHFGLGGIDTIDKFVVQSSVGEKLVFPGPFEVDRRYTLDQG